MERPTRHLRTFVNKHIQTAVLPDDYAFPDLGTGDIPTLMAPGNTLDTAPLNVSLDELEEVIEGRAHLYFYGWAEYDDVFQGTARHRTEFCYRIEMGGNPRNPKQFSPRWQTHPRYNGADEECEGPLRTVSPKDIGNR
jgi:hypothetical protein